MNNTYAADNERERQRLFLLTAKLTEAELTRQMANGWSVAATLVHLAFWDLYCVALIEEWERSGFRVSSLNVDAINEAVRLLFNAFLREYTVQAADEAIDQRLEELWHKLEAAIEARSNRRGLQSAFWGLYDCALINQWERTGCRPSSVNVDTINETVRMLSDVNPEEAAVNAVLNAAEAIDRKLDELTAELEAAIEASGNVRILRRAMHRREHLDQIEKVLAHNSA